MTATEASSNRTARAPVGDVVTAHDHEQETTWTVESAWRDRLFGPDAPDWFALETSPAAEHVKTGHEREVWRVRLGDAEVYAKVRSVDATPLGWLGGEVVRLTSGGRREWEIARRAWAKGVPVVHFVALGHRAGHQPADVLISEAIPDAQTLAAAWAETRESRWRDSSRWCEDSRWCENPLSHPPAAESGSPPLDGVGSRLARSPRLSIIHAVARLFADAHQRGFAHHDNHPYNILIYPRGAELEAVFVDVIPASLSSTRAAYRRILASLAHLDQYFHRVATRTERLRFLRAYLESLQAADGPRDERLMEHRLVPAILRERARHALRLARRRDQRIWRKGKYFSTLRIPGQAGAKIRATVVIDLERRHLYPEAETPDRSEGEWRNILRVFAAAVPKPGMLSPGEASEARERLDPSAIAHELARHGLQCETLQPAGLLQRLTWTFFGSPHRRAFGCAHQLRHRDILAPLLLSYVERRELLITQTYVVSPASIKPGDAGPGSRSSLPAPSPSPQ